MAGGEAAPSPSPSPAIPCYGPTETKIERGLGDFLRSFSLFWLSKSLGQTEVIG